jgi:hypothetical protein
VGCRRSALISTSVPGLGRHEFTWDPPGRFAVDVLFYHVAGPCAVSGLMAVKAIRRERMDKRIDTGSVVVTKSNMYTSENQKLLFPFVDK